MDNPAVQCILTRRSIRRYTDRPVEPETVRLLLEAAMAAPSARNGQPWEYVVMTDRELLARMSRVGPYAGPLAGAPLGILVCARAADPGQPDYWVVDCAAAVENILLAAHALGLGAVWLGVWPRRERQQYASEALGLPDSVIPHSAIAIGYPAEEKGPAGRYSEDRVHWNRW